MIDVRIVGVESSHNCGFESNRVQQRLTLLASPTAPGLTAFAVVPSTHELIEVWKHRAECHDSFITGERHRTVDRGAVAISLSPNFDPQFVVVFCDIQIVAKLLAQISDHIAISDAECVAQRARHPRVPRCLVELRKPR